MAGRPKTRARLAAAAASGPDATDVVDIGTIGLVDNASGGSGGGSGDGGSDGGGSGGSLGGSDGGGGSGLGGSGGSPKRSGWPKGRSRAGSAKPADKAKDTLDLAGLADGLQFAHWLASLGLANERLVITSETAAAIVGAIDKVLSYHPTWRVYLIAMGAATGEGAAWGGLAIILARTYLPMLAPGLAAQTNVVMGMMAPDGEVSGDPAPVH